MVLRTFLAPGAVTTVRALAAEWPRTGVRQCCVRECRAKNVATLTPRSKTSALDRRHATGDETVVNGTARARTRSQETYREPGHVQGSRTHRQKLDAMHDLVVRWFEQYSLLSLEISI